MTKLFVYICWEEIQPRPQNDDSICLYWLGATAPPRRLRQYGFNFLGETASPPRRPRYYCFAFSGGVTDPPRRPRKYFSFLGGDTAPHTTTIILIAILGRCRSTAQTTTKEFFIAWARLQPRPDSQDSMFLHYWGGCSPAETSKTVVFVYWVGLHPRRDEDDCMDFLSWAGLQRHRYTHYSIVSHSWARLQPYSVEQDGVGFHSWQGCRLCKSVMYRGYSTPKSAFEGGASGQPFQCVQ